jgi:thioredoxin-related protein
MLLAILLAVSGVFPLVADAQRALSTPRGTGRPPIARGATLPLAEDLAADAGRSAKERRPILLFFDRAECPYCERALREYLVPLARDEWKDRVLFRQVEIDEALPVRFFDGRMTTHAAVAARYGASLSPTVVFVDGGGNLLAGPLVGLMVDFYGAYLEDALMQAMRKLAN